MARVFFQVGGSRDGSDAYRQIATGYDWTTVLVETEAFLRHRRSRGWQRFDREIAVADPTDPAQVVSALLRFCQGEAFEACAALPGFETSTKAVAAFENQQRLATDPPFLCHDKLEQRLRLSRTRSTISQPAYAFVRNPSQIVSATEGMPFPLVVKPANSGGGLGVELAADREQVVQASCRLTRLSNYGGTPLRNFIVEAFVPGPERSLQGFVVDGAVNVLSSCSKIVAREIGREGAQTFREAAHIAGCPTPAERDFARTVLSDLGYQNGPFHIDLIENGDERVFIEAGFRLPGLGICELIRRVCGVSLPMMAFAIATGETRPASQPSAPVGAPIAGRCGIWSERGLAEAERLARDMARPDISIEIELCANREAPASTGSSPDLMSDRLRHFDRRAAVWMEGQDFAAIHAGFSAVVEADGTIDRSTTGLGGDLDDTRVLECAG